ncbi:CLUMA_CG013700, isoform A [Clunio marinus]|uniref:CLUMA_CG013700, isoform A n=1 Tax=Clunio marinus TaxID=568069 RepID=A0A1J1IKZ1_9DIPT|nr:CLUMA_CG013700, isoform A [Clunio marinus]
MSTLTDFNFHAEIAQLIRSNCINKPLQTDGKIQSNRNTKHTSSRFEILKQTKCCSKFMLLKSNEREN